VLFESGVHAAKPRIATWTSLPLSGQTPGILVNNQAGIPR